MAVEGEQVLGGASLAAQRKAGFWIRVGAWIIDGILLSIVGRALDQIFGPGVGAGLGILIGLAYSLYFWTTTGQTIGHKALSLRVIKTDGQRLSIVDGLVRYVGEFISGIVICLGFMWVGWDGNKQGWHDKMAHTYVVRV